MLESIKFRSITLSPNETIQNLVSRIAISAARTHPFLKGHDALLTGPTRGSVVRDRGSLDPGSIPARCNC